jgi:hypothetical protein
MACDMRQLDESMAGNGAWQFTIAGTVNVVEQGAVGGAVGTKSGGGVGATGGGVGQEKMLDVEVLEIWVPSAKVAVIDWTPLKVRGKHVKRMPFAVVTWLLQMEQVATPGAQMVNPPEVNGQPGVDGVTLNNAWKLVPQTLGEPATIESWTLAVGQFVVGAKRRGFAWSGGGVGVGAKRGGFTWSGGGIGVGVGGATGAGVLQVKVPEVLIEATRAPYEKVAVRD